MIYHLSFSFWLQMVYFWVCIFLAFFIPGNLFLSRQKIDTFTKIVLSTGVGMVLWGLQGLFFGYLHVRWMSYIYVLVACIVFVQQNKKFRLYNPFKNFQLKKYVLTSILLFLGIFIQLSTVWFNGIPMNRGDYYCCGDTRDNIVHIAITKSTIQNIPPMEPGMYGQVIKNYHYFGSVIVGELVRVFDLPLIQTDYQYMTVFISLLLGLSLISFGIALGMPFGFINWLLFFMYFGGDFVFGLRFITTHEINFNMSSLEDGSKFLANYPRAFAIDACIVGMTLLVLWLKDKRNRILGGLMAIVLGSIIGLKVYVGIFVLVGISALLTISLLRKQFALLPYWIGTVLLTLVLYIPVNSGAGGLYFTGFWLFENYISQPGFNLIRLELARTIYEEHHSVLRVISYELFYILIYSVSIFWTKLLGIFQSKKSLSYFPRELHIFLISGLVVSFTAGAFFQQGTGGANTFNFLVSFFVFLSFYTALACFYWIGKMPKIAQVIVIIFIVFTTVPRVAIETFKNLGFVARAEGYIIPQDQLNAFAYIDKNIPQNAIILVDQRLQFEPDKQAPYVFVYTGRRLYLSGQVDDLLTHGVNFEAREKHTELLVNNNSCTTAALLSKSPIEYILTNEDTFFGSSRSAEFATKIYENDTVRFLKVNKNSVKSFITSMKTNQKINCFE